MSMIEVSLMIPDYGNQSASDRNNRRPQAQRPPPPTPIQSQPQASSPVPSLHPNPEAFSSTPSLLSEFQRLFDGFDYASVREEILNRRMIDSNFATVLWRIFLHCLPRDPQQWDEMLDISRYQYQKLDETYKIDPYKKMLEENDLKNVNHPLSQDRQSFWAQYFEAEDLRKSISIDVRRTYPDVEFFRNPRMIEKQINILYTYCKHHETTTPYRQGMHEILGIIVYSIHVEACQVNEYPESNAIMKNLYNPEYLEHDAYCIFEKVMEHIREFYIFSPKQPRVPKNQIVNETKQVPFQPPKPVHIPQSPLAQRIASIFDRLIVYDPALHHKLVEWKIEPMVYGVRWLRLLFGREILFGSIPSLWTVIFCFDESFRFVDNFFLALLLEFGQTINTEADVGHPECLQLLMKHNFIKNVEPVIRKALTLTGRELPAADGKFLVLPIRQIHETQVNPPQNDRKDEVRRTELQRVPIAPAPRPRLTRPKPDAGENIVSSTQKNNSNSHFPSASQSGSTTELTEIESELWTGKTVRQRFDDHIQLQKRCGRYMNQFIERLQTIVYDMHPSNENEIMIQLSGLKQIASTLEGNLTFDPESIEGLLHYRREKKVAETNNNETNS